MDQWTRRKIKTAILGEGSKPARKKRYTSRRVEEEEDGQNCLCGKAIESRSHIVAECELYKEEREVLDGEMRDVNKGGVESFDTLDTKEKTMAILGDGWWPETAKQDGDKICEKFLCNVWKKRHERQNVGGVSIRSRNGAASRKGCVVNRQTTEASNK
ncbi:unnamed protein product [Sphacelaria rigidula]